MESGLWPHQVEAVEKICAELGRVPKQPSGGTGGRVTVIAACGTGKTIVGAESSVRLAPSGRVLVLVPTLELLAQTAHAYAAHLGAAAGVIAAVCGDQRATESAAKLRAEMGDLHAPVTTDPTTIATTGQRVGRVTVFATYMSVPAIIAAHRDHGLETWDLLVVDEAHRTAGVKGQWAQVHDDRLMPADGFELGRWLGKRRADYKAGTLSADLIAELESYGVDWHIYARQLDARWERNIARLTEYRRVHGDANPRGHYRSPDGFGLGTWVAISRRQFLAGDLSTEQIADFERLGTRLHPRTAGDARRDNSWRLGLSHLQEFHREHGHADVPSRCVTADGFGLGAWMLARRQDHRDGKLRAERAAELTALGVDLRVADHGWDNRCAELASYHSHHGQIDIPYDYQHENGIRLGAWLSEQRRALRDGKLDAEQSSRLRALGVTPATEPTALARPGTTWDQQLAALRAYRDEHGDLDIPAHHKLADGYVLGVLLRLLRRQYHKDTLPIDRVRDLETLGMDWRWPREALWDKGLAALRAFRDQYGHVDVQGRYITGDGHPLGSWLQSRRNEHARGALSPERQLILTDLGVDLLGRRATWDIGLAALREYHRIHGEGPVGIRYVTDDGYKLGQWIGLQRTNHRRGALSADRIAILAELGVDVAPRSNAWADNLAVLAGFGREHGHIRVPYKFVTADGRNLGEWVVRQRKFYRQQRLSEQQIRDLTELGFDFQGGTRRKSASART